MKHQNQWTRLQWLAELKLQRSAEVLASEQGKVRDAKQQADDFHQFKAGLTEQLRDQPGSLQARMNGLGFLNKLDDAIDVSERRVELAEADLGQAKQAWQAYKSKTDAYQSLIDKQHAMRLRQEAHHSDRASSEQFNLRKYGGQP